MDLIPAALFPVVGWFDDLTFVWLALRWLVKSAPPDTPAPLPPVKT